MISKDNDYSTKNYDWSLTWSIKSQAAGMIYSINISEKKQSWFMYVYLGEPFCSPLSTRIHTNEDKSKNEWLEERFPSSTRTFRLFNRRSMMVIWSEIEEKRRRRKRQITIGRKDGKDKSKIDRSTDRFIEERRKNGTNSTLPMIDISPVMRHPHESPADVNQSDFASPKTHFFFSVEVPSCQR